MKRPTDFFIGLTRYQTHRPMKIKGSAGHSMTHKYWQDKLVAVKLSDSSAASLTSKLVSSAHFLGRTELNTGGLRLDRLL